MLLPYAVSGPRAAEKSLADAADSPNYGLVVLRLVAEHTVDDQIRHAAAVNFKIHLRYRWAPSSDSNSGTTLAPILDPEKEQIKALIVTRMLSSSTPRIQSQLSEALAVIGKRFPKIVAHSTARTRFNLRIASQSNDYASINGILGTTNSIFKKFCYQCKTNDLLLDLKIVSIIFALIDSTLSSGGSAVTLQRLFESQRLYCRIFYSLNFQDLPGFFEDHMKEWMGEFKKYLTTIYPALESSSDGLGVVDELKAAVCENISLYMEVNEECQGYLNDFALSV